MHILVEWNYGLADYTGFLLQRSIDFGATWPVNLSFPSTSLQYSDTNITFSGNTYSYKIAATNTFGTGAFSNTGSVTLFGVSVSQPQDVTVNLSAGAPLIVSNPSDQITSFSGTASFTVSASGDIPLSYYWLSGSTFLIDDTRITGSNSASLRINNIQLTDSGSYRVLVSNAVGYVYSNYADLTVFNSWGEDWESYPTGSIETSSVQSFAFGTEGTIRLGNTGIIAIENINAYSGSPALDSGFGWVGSGIIN